MIPKEYNINWEQWQKKFGGRYIGHVSRPFSWLLERKIGLIPLDVTGLPQIFNLLARKKTALEPKQVVYHPESELAFVSCMKGKKLQIFSCKKDILVLTTEISFEEQCVEVAIDENLCFLTLSKFSREPGSADKLAIIDIEDKKVIALINTEGNWSKVIKKHPDGLIFISNWRSNNLSIVDIIDPLHPKVIQLLSCGISPRGIAFSKSGELGLVAGFYSRNIIEICKTKSKHFDVSYIGKPYDYPNYSGCMRDIIIDSNDEYAYISNLGRNLIHRYNISSRKIVDSVVVGRYPNSITFFDSSEKKLLVSCRESNTVCLLDLNTRKVEGCAETKIKESTGLCTFPGGFLATSFAENSLELYKITNGYAENIKKFSK